MFKKQVKFISFMVFVLNLGGCVTPKSPTSDSEQNSQGTSHPPDSTSSSNSQNPNDLGTGTTLGQGGRRLNRNSSTVRNGRQATASSKEEYFKRLMAAIDACNPNEVSLILEELQKHNIQDVVNMQSEDGFQPIFMRSPTWVKRIAAGKAT